MMYEFDPENPVTVVVIMENDWSEYNTMELPDIEGLPYDIAERAYYGYTLMFTRGDIAFLDKHDVEINNKQRKLHHSMKVTRFQLNEISLALELAKTLK